MDIKEVKAGMPTISITITPATDPVITKTISMSAADLDRFMTWLTFRTATPGDALASPMSNDDAVAAWFKFIMEQSIFQQTAYETRVIQEVAIPPLPPQIDLSPPV